MHVERTGTGKTGQRVCKQVHGSESPGVPMQLSIHGLPSAFACAPAPRSALLALWLSAATLTAARPR